MTLLFLLLVALQEPRAHLVELQRAGKVAQALEETERLIRVEPGTAERLGLHYLRGHLLDSLGRRSEAILSFAESLSATPKLDAHARLRIARDQELLGHPEVAAGLTATLLGSNPPRSVVGPATELLVRALEAGGDCRLVTTLPSQRFPASQRRLLELARANCDLRAGHTDPAQQRLIALLREKSSDLTALYAAHRLSQFKEAVSQPATVRLLGLTFHSHRQFDRSSNLLQQVVIQQQPKLRSAQEFETRYRFVRSHFWLGRYELAAQHYADLASRAVTPQQIAQALYHRGRSLELAGQWTAAIEGFRRAYLAQRQGNFSAAALLGALRLEWRIGREEQALELYDVLGTSRVERSRAALFFAASDIVKGRADRAERWLAEAQSAHSSASQEVAYWRGRLAEAQGQTDDAVTAYARATEKDYFHPIAQLALERLRSPQLLDRSRALGRALSEGSGDLYHAWVLLGLDAADGNLQGAVRGRLEARFRRENRGQPIVATDLVPIESWPLWSAPLLRPEELLLALGVWEEGAPVVLRHFPVANPPLALTAARELERAGRTKDSLLIAEILNKRVPKRFESAFLPHGFREVLYPYSYRYLIERSAKRHGVSPFLLAALIREESKFDPRASSAAAARGLTQFVITTAERIARAQGMGPISPRELEKPEVAIELGAAYLRELGERYQGRWAHAIAAYNAGEPQAHLWERYCYTPDSAEFFTKVAFRETRSYLGRVLTSFGQYRDLYSQPRQRAAP